jgi:hypothetical protein
MTTLSAVRNMRAGDAALPPLGLSSVVHRQRCSSLNFFGSRKVTFRGLSGSLRLIHYLIGESDDFESRNRLNWWSYGAFARQGQLEGNQYLSGRRAPPFLHR